MTRFMRDLNGEFGSYWKEQAEKELETTRAALKHGNITIGINGIRRNCIGRALSDDVLEKVAMVSDEIDVQATKQARAEEVAANIKAYRENYTPPSREELLEMQTAFGTGTTVVDILTGKEIQL